MRQLVWAVLFAATAVRGAAALTPANVMMSLELPESDRLTLVRSALADPDPHVRAAAARVITVTDARDLLPSIREHLAREDSVDAAREDLRAIGVLEGLPALGYVLEQGRRFQPALDADGWVAIARGSGPAAVEEFLQRKPDALIARAVFLHALWGHPKYVTAYSARILGLREPALWQAWLDTLHEPDLTLPPTFVVMALTHSVPEIATATTWYVVDMLTGRTATYPKELLDALDSVKSQDGVPVELAVAREMLSRILGRAPNVREQWTQWVAASSRKASLAALLTPDELRTAHIAAPAAHAATSPVRLRAFTSVISLPAEAGYEILSKLACRADWIGTASAETDSAGRIRSLDLTNVQTSPECRRALNVLVRGSFAENTSAATPMKTQSLLLVRDHRADFCVDEQSAELSTTPEWVVQTGGPAVAPSVIEHFEADPFSLGPGHGGLTDGTVVMDVVVDHRGCVAAEQMVEQSSNPAFNRAALLALSRWRFSAATLNGHAVSSRWRLTMTYRSSL